MRPMLDLQGLTVAIEGVTVLRRAELQLPPGAAVALIGRNGAGKTTLLRTVMGFVPLREGRIQLDGQAIEALPAHRRPPLGIGYAPEDRRLFAAFTVEENILLPAQVCRLEAGVTRTRLEMVYEVVPELQEMRGRGAGSLSGGQGKMVALGRALMIGSRVVLLDEPFQGLAPALARRYADVLRKLRDRIPELALLISESNPALLHDFADVTYLIERGEVSRLESGAAAPS